MAPGSPSRRPWQTSGTAGGSLPANAYPNGHPYQCGGAPDCVYCDTIARPTGRKTSFGELARRRNTPQ